MTMAVNTRNHQQLCCNRRTSFWWYVHAAIVVALVSMNLSTATYNPAQHPQNVNWNPVQQQAQHVQWEDPARGGSTMAATATTEYPPPPPQQMVEEEPYHPPTILLKHMSMALRVTSEWNRRLLHGANRFNKFFWKKQADIAAAAAGASQDASSYGTLPVNVHPSRSWRPPIPGPPPTNEDDHLTLFHAKAPREISKEKGGSDDNDAAVARGVARWGPELLPYLEHIVDLLGISSEGGVEIPLAMIYLDRACSVETPRSNGVPPCPFCTPRTVHRLSLASLLLATQAVKGWTDAEMLEQYDKIFASLGIPEVQLQQMVDWMRGALGDAGLMVTVTQMKEWGRNWESIFSPWQHVSRRQRLEQTPTAATDTASTTTSTTANTPPPPALMQDEAPAQQNYN